jgi:hypothetical protein
MSRDRAEVPFCRALGRPGSLHPHWATGRHGQAGTWPARHARSAVTPGDRGGRRRASSMARQLADSDERQHARPHRRSHRTAPDHAQRGVEQVRANGQGLTHADVAVTVPHVRGRERPVTRRPGQAAGIVMARLCDTPADIGRDRRAGCAQWRQVPGTPRSRPGPDRRAGGPDRAGHVWSPSVMRIRMPLLAGTVLSLAAVAAVASQDPGPAALPGMSIRHPLASYRALAAAPSGNGLELFAMVAFIYAACIFIASWRHQRRQRRGTAARRRPAQRGGRGQPVRPQPRRPDQVRCPPLRTAGLSTGRRAPHRARSAADRRPAGPRPWRRSGGSIAG